ncbi:NAD(P)H-hydrate dehydratase [Konateibacter massiliensis]|uniref:NAD(P)H-hydrate dehydratase n=1 Tax=Konateibacter massiliensis TaxID=2002841 RepID=UPI000C154863|nr:NAD(P)H-hydrate dehydratase [Konateibacter massiliensis]
MEYLLTSNEMKKLDSDTIEKIGIPSAVLMEKAALGVIAEMKKNCGDFESVLVVCGSGNNGGDGIAIGRILALQGKTVRIVFVGEEEKASVETKRQLQIARKYNFKIYNTFGNSEYNVIIDAVFGIGLTREITGVYRDAIENINKADGYKVAVDIPSGISADTGKAMGCAVKADLTVAIAFKKIGHVLYPGAGYCGETAVCDIGIYPPLNSDFAFSYDKTDSCRLPARTPYSNKGTYGKALIIAGGINMAGAAYLAAISAYKTGCGLVRLLIPEENREILQTLIPEAILTTYDSKNLDLVEIEKAVSWANVIDIGPGLGTGEPSRKLMETVLKRKKCPLIIDADGINLLALDSKLWEENLKDIVITPHLKEMSVICKSEIEEIKEDLIGTAVSFAKKHKLVCVLKDARTVVADYEKKVYINQNGNNGMAKAGSGDILSGIIAGLLAQGMAPFDGATLGVYIHAAAGDEAAKRLGTYSMLARDIAEMISNVTSE